MISLPANQAAAYLRHRERMHRRFPTVTSRHPGDAPHGAILGAKVKRLRKRVARLKAAGVHDLVAAFRDDPIFAAVASGGPDAGAA